MKQWLPLLGAKYATIFATIYDSPHCFSLVAVTLIFRRFGCGLWFHVELLPSRSSPQPRVSCLFWHVLSPEEALREGGDEADFNEEAKHRLECGKGRDGTIQREGAGEEAAPVKGGNAEHKSISEWERTRDQVDTGEDEDG